MDAKCDEAIASRKLLSYPEIHSHISGFLDANDLQNIRFVNITTKQFIDKSNTSRTASIKLSNSDEIDEFIIYLQDSNNKILLENLKTISFDIDLNEGLTYRLQVRLNSEQKDGRGHGRGTLTIPARYTYCFGIKYLILATVYVGNWHDDRKNGYGVYTYTDGHTYEQEYKDGAKWNGIFVSIDGDTVEFVEFEMV